MHKGFADRRFSASGQHVLNSLPSYLGQQLQKIQAATENISVPELATVHCNCLFAPQKYRYVLTCQLSMTLSSLLTEVKTISKIIPCMLL